MSERCEVTEPGPAFKATPVSFIPCDGSGDVEVSYLAADGQARRFVAHANNETLIDLDPGDPLNVEFRPESQTLAITFRHCPC